MTLFWDHTGPLIKYDGEVLKVEDLNPEMRLQWRMSRGEMLRLGWRCIAAAFMRL